VFVRLSEGTAGDAGDSQPPVRSRIRIPADDIDSRGEEEEGRGACMYDYTSAYTGGIGVAEYDILESVRGKSE